MGSFALVTFFGCLFFAHSVLAVRQYVEIERRPNTNNDFAGTFVFVFGLLATFVSIVVGLRFGWAFFRSSIARASFPPQTTPKNQIREGDILFQNFY